MRNADRIIRVIFRNLISLESAKKSEDSLSYELSSDKWSFGNSKFVDKVCSKYLEIYPNNYSYDEIRVLLDEEINKLKDYFKIEYNEVDPLHMFMYYSDKLFIIRNEKMIVNFNDLFEWNGFATKVDGTVFQGAFLRNYETENCNTIIEHNESRIYKILSSGICENHMHLYGSGYSWELNLKNLVHKSPLSMKKEQFKGHLKVDKYKEFNQNRIYRLQVIRTYLLSVLIKENISENFDIEKILKTESFMFSEIDELDRIYESAKKRFNKYEGDYQEIILKEREFYKLIFQLVERKELTRIQINLIKLYIAEMSNIKFRFVQDNIGMGFAKFSDIQNIKSAFFDENDDIKNLESVLDKYYSEKCIVGIEARIAPNSDSNLFDQLSKIEKANQKVYEHHRQKDKKIKKIKIGVIIHYIKLDEKSIPNECRHFKLRQKLKKEAQYLSKYFEKIKEIDEVSEVNIVGIDAANVEIQCAPEIFAPIFKKHRAEISQKHKLGFTYHVGEDFLNISSGLRAIDDVIEFMDFDKNDRLGHAIALGINIEEYIKKKRNVVVSTLQSYVDDLAWLHKVLHLAEESELHIRSELNFLYLSYANQLFLNTGSATPDITTYQESYSLRGKCPEVFRVSNDELCIYDNVKNSNATALNSKTRELYHAYHYNEVFRLNGQKSISACAGKIYVKACVIAQRILHEKIHSKGITIEINPTSNKKISSVSEYKELPLWTFNSHVLCQNQHRKNLQVSINTDDSAIFETNLINEYSCIALSLIKDGYQREAVMDYIKYLSNMSKQTTFLDID